MQPTGWNSGHKDILNFNFKVKQLSILIIILLFLSSCEKDEHSCYDEELYLEHTDDGCWTDCPGVTGCDGKFYCNECEANKRGIRIIK